MEIALVICTCPAEIVEQVVEPLLQERLAASVDQLVLGWSRYAFNTEIIEDDVLLLITTADHLTDAVHHHILALHPLERAMIVSVALRESYENYITWIRRRLDNR